MERFNRTDVRFAAICLALIAAGGLVTALLFRRAFPEASIEFRVNRTQARALAEKFLASRGRNVSSLRFAGRFEVEEEPKVYLERELGLERAGPLFGTQARVWRWNMRWFRSGVKEEERVGMTPLGDLVSFESVRRDDAPGPRPRQEEARAIAASFLSSRGLAPDRLRAVEARPRSRPARTDWTFVDERLGLRLGQATVRYETTVSGGSVTAYREFLHVPESWTREYRKLRSRNEAAGIVASFGFFLTILAMLAVLVGKIVLRDVPWRLVAAFGVTAFVLALLSALNGLPLTLYDYDTASSLTSYLTNQVVFSLLGAIATGAGIAVVMAASEPIYRERFPRLLSLPGLFSKQGIRTRTFFRSVLLGYALTAFFFAYQAVFYVLAARLGAWAPADIPYDDMLNTAFPWATVLLIGFLPAVSEEGISRMFSIAFLDRIGAGRFVAVVLPAFLWGFGHSAYPNQPFYIRGLEVGLAGVLIGWLMLRFGVLPLLVWHFTVDAVYTALLMLRSSNAYYVATGAVASGILLLPLAVSLVLALRRGGFASEAGLSNGEIGFVAKPPPPALAPEPVPPDSPVRRRALWVSAAAAALLAATFLLPVGSLSRFGEDRTGRSVATGIARRFLAANGVNLDAYRTVAYPGTGFADDEEVQAERPQETGRIPGFSSAAARYVLTRGGADSFERLASGPLPVSFWVVRFFQAEKKEEWKVLVDARRSRVAGFVHPVEETAPAAAAPPPDRTKKRAIAAAALLGYPASEYTVAEVGREDRPRRTDTSVVLEAGSLGVAEARPRLTAGFHGPRMASMLPSVRVPESFLREDRRHSAAEWILLAAKVVAVGAWTGIGILLFLRLVREAGFRWRRLSTPLAAAALFALLATGNRFNGVLRQYRTDYPLTTFLVTAGISLLILWLLLVCVAGIGFVLFSGARPGWRQALRRKGSLPDALWRAVIGATGLAGLAHLSSVLTSRYPTFFEPDPSMPEALARIVPSFDVLWSAAGATTLLAAAAAVGVLAVRQKFFRGGRGAALAAATLIVVLLPLDARSPGEFAASTLLSVLSLIWLAVCAFVLLRDHAAAWVLFGALAFGGPLVVELLSQGAAEDRSAGWVGLLLLVAACAALLAGRRDREKGGSGETPAPDPAGAAGA